MSARTTDFLRESLVGVYISQFALEKRKREMGLVCFPGEDFETIRFVMFVEEIIVDVLIA